MYPLRVCVCLSVHVGVMRCGDSEREPSVEARAVRLIIINPIDLLITHTLSSITFM